MSREVKIFSTSVWRPGERLVQQKLGEYHIYYDAACPNCEKESLYSWSKDRFFHIDGSDNQRCWKANGNAIL